MAKSARIWYRVSWGSAGAGGMVGGAQWWWGDSRIAPTGTGWGHVKRNPPGRLIGTSRIADSDGGGGSQGGDSRIAPTGMDWGPSPDDVIADCPYGYGNSASLNTRRKVPFAGPLRTVMVPQLKASSKVSSTRCL